MIGLLARCGGTGLGLIRGFQGGEGGFKELGRGFGFYRLPESGCGHDLGGRLPADLLPALDLLDCGGRQDGFLGAVGVRLAAEFEPNQPAWRLMGRRLQLGGRQPFCQRRAERVTGDVDRMALGEPLGGRVGFFYSVFLVTSEPLAGAVQAQKLLQLLLATGERLPQQQVGRFGQGGGQIAGEQRTGAKTPKPEWPAGAWLLVEPGVGELQVGQPGGPGGICEVARAVTAAKEVDLHHRKTGLSQGAGLAGNSAAGGVDFLGKWGEKQHPPALRSAGPGWVKQTKTLAAVRRVEKKGVGQVGSAGRGRRLALVGLDAAHGATWAAVMRPRR